jgi:hypothetical protein
MNIHLKYSIPGKGCNFILDLGKSQIKIFKSFGGDGRIVTGPLGRSMKRCLPIVGIALLLMFEASAQTESPMAEHMGMRRSISGADSAQAREELHMAMTALRPARAADEDRASQLVEIARSRLSKYRDYKVSEKDGYHIVRTPVDRVVYHFTKYEYLRAAESGEPFQADRPVSLIYRKHRDRFELIGVM